MLNNQREARETQLIPNGPGIEESKGMQFPESKRNRKKQDEHSDSESEKENQNNTNQTFFSIRKL